MSSELEFLSGISDESDLSGSDYEESLIWDSEDSRPASPSPPSSLDILDVSQVNVAPRTRRARLLIISDSENETIETYSQQESGEYFPPSPPIYDGLDTTDDFAIIGSPVIDNDSDATRFSEDTVMMDGEEFDESPRSPASPIQEPQSPQNEPLSAAFNIIPILNYNPSRPVIMSVESLHPLDNGNAEEEVQEIIQIVDEPSDSPSGVEPLEIPHDINPEPTKPIVPDANLPIPTLETSTLSDADEGSLCTICMDPLTNSGKHRVVCLRCGHIFGQACVERWIKVGCNNGAKRCPTCNKRAYLKDIRVLYLPKVVPVDTVEKDRLIEEKEQIMMQKKACEMELSRSKLQNTLASKNYDEKIHKLEKELMEAIKTIEHLKQRKEYVHVPAINIMGDRSRPELLHIVDISKDGGCRVMAFNPFLKNLVISQPSGNTIFAGFGVRVINSVDFAPSRFVYLHQKMIRDLCFHGEDRDLLLSVSLDQTAKLLDIGSNTTVHTFRDENPLWACCWDLSNPHLLLVGSQVGKVCQYDRRMMDDCVNTWERNNNCTPVVALSSVPPIANTPFPQGGFLSCRLNGMFAYARHGEKYTKQELQLEGPFMSMKYEPMSQTLLSASRPSSRCPYVKLNLNLLDKDASGNICLPKIHSFNCGSSVRVMSRLTTLSTRNDTLVVAHHDSGRSINMWSAKTGELVHSIPSKESVIDFTSFNILNNNMLAALSEKKVGIYKIP